MSDAGLIAYEERFEVMLDHIREHLHEPLDLIRVAEVVGLSPRHWHRVVTAAFGETVPRLVRRLRMERAATLLVTTDLPVSAVAMACGYPDVSSFTRTFRQETALPPVQYRDRGGHAAMRLARVRGDVDRFDVDIRTMRAVDTIAAPHRGSYLTIDQAFDDLRIWSAAHGHDLLDSQLFGVFLSDPTSTPESELRSLACVALPHGLDLPLEPLTPHSAPVRPFRIRGGAAAVLRHQGAYADMPDTYAWLFGTWLPASGQRPSDEPVVEHYVSFPRDERVGQAVTELILPLHPGVSRSKG